MQLALPLAVQPMPTFGVLVTGTFDSSRSQLAKGMLRRRMVPWQMV